MLTNGFLFGNLTKLSAAARAAARLRKPQHNTERFDSKTLKKVLDKQNELCYLNKIAAQQLRKNFLKNFEKKCLTKGFG